MDVSSHSTALWSASKLVARTCQMQNEAFLSCKETSRNPSDCLAQGKDVLQCVSKLYVERDDVPYDHDQDTHDQSCADECSRPDHERCEPIAITCSVPFLCILVCRLAALGTGELKNAHENHVDCLKKHNNNMSLCRATERALLTAFARSGDDAIAASGKQSVPTVPSNGTEPTMSSAVLHVKGTGKGTVATVDEVLAGPDYHWTPSGGQVTTNGYEWVET